MGFESEIKPWFRERDRDEMSWAFDLWNYDDVRGHAAQILERVEEGSMPCDEPWPKGRIEAFRSWIEGAMPR